MKYSVKNRVVKPFLHCKNNISIKVNNEFEKLTGYLRDELLGKSLAVINEMLGLDSQICLEDVESECSCYLFTKEYEPREVNIFCERISQNEQIYYIKEKWDSRIENKLQYILTVMKDNQTGVVILSACNGIVLKANEKFLNYLEISHSNTSKYIGKKFGELNDKFDIIALENIFSNVIKTGKSFYSKEFKFNDNHNDIYFDTSFVPIHISGEIKYVVYTALDITERVISKNIIKEQQQELKIQNKELKEQKQELEVILENMSDCIYVADKGFNIKLLNSSMRKVLYEPDLFKKAGDTLKYIKYYNSDGKLFPIDDSLSSMVFRGEKFKDYRLTAHRPDGIYHYSSSGSPIYDENGNILKAIICTRDITEQVNKDELILQQKEELEAIIENISDGIYTVDRDFNVTLLNNSSRENLYESDILKKVGDTLKNIKYYDFDGNLITLQDFTEFSILKGERIKDHRYTAHRPDGIFHFSESGSPIYDKSGNVIKAIICVRDITEQVNKDELIKQHLLVKAQYESLNDIIEQLDFGFTRCSYPELKFNDINNKAYNQLKEVKPNICAKSLIIGQSMLDVFGESFNIIENIQNTIKNNFNSYYKIYKYNILGEEIFHKYIYQPLFGLNDEVVEIIIIGIDVTEEEKAKNKMAEALEIQDEIYANVSHELKTPLNVIFSANQLMDIYIKSGSIETYKDKLSNYNHSIKQNCYRLVRLINNIVDLSKIKSKSLKYNPTNVNIVEVIENIVQSVWDYVKSKELGIVFDTNIENKIIACDPENIERIMLNLISNAIKFSNAGDKIYVNIFDKGEFIEITVKDTGVGIDKKNLDYVFNRFYQEDKSLSRNAEGSGIGLSLVKSIVEMHGGKISVESEVGKGSTFTVKLLARTIENSKVKAQDNFVKNKIEMINIEFSDIYDI